jgi:protein tyrosine phosphatase (PTP) superfamily phosphohydrolase (DUF442 family)
MAPSPAAPPRRPSFLRPVLRGCLAGLALAAAAEAVRVLLGPNFHEVVPGAVYRCSQPSAADLERFARRYHVRTIVNLRGCCDEEDWYLDECRTAARFDVSVEDLNGVSAGRLPSVHTVRQLVAILDQAERPILIHCHKGIDRTGMTSAIALLLYTDASLPRARLQLSLRYGHLPFGRTGNIDRFFDLYQEWLAGHGGRHEPALFRRWLLEDYCPGECRCDLRVLDPTGAPLRLPAGRSCGVRVRAANTSVKPWRLRPGNTAGIHLAWFLLDADQRVLLEERAGLFEATVPPGESIDLTLAVPPLKPGRYFLRADMIDEQQGSFFQAGSEPLLTEVEVP